MKKFYISLAVLFGYISVDAQIVNIPDPKFKTKLMQSGPSSMIAKNLSGFNFKIDANNDGEIQVSEASQVSQLNIINPNPAQRISSLEGIDAFVNLQNLNCSMNSLTSLDVSGLSSLTILNASQNELTSIDVEGLSNLVELQCNNNELSSLNISGLISLEKLYCTYNNITALDLGGLQNLKMINATQNEIASLDVSDQQNLTNMDCSWNGMSSLTLGTLPNLVDLDCSVNELTSIDMSGLSIVTNLKVGGNNLTALDVSNLDDLVILDANGGNFTSIDLSNLTDLETFNCNLCQLTSLNITPLANLKFLDISNNMNITSLDLSASANLESLFFSNSGIVTLDLSPVAGQLLDLSYSNNTFLPIDLSTFINLKTLSIINASLLTNLDVSNLADLEYIFINNSNLESLDLSSNAQLHTVRLTYNGALATLNLKNGGSINADATNQYYINNNLSLLYICINEGDYENIMSSMTAFLSDIQVNSYCSFNPGGLYNTLAGTVRFDGMANGCDATDPIVRNVRIGIDDGTTSGATFSNNSGAYSFFVQEPDITLTADVENPTFFNITPIVSLHNFPANNGTVTTQNYCLTPNGVHNDLEVLIMPAQQAVPGFDVTYNIMLRNKGNMVETGYVEFTYDDDLIDLLSTSEAPSSQSSGMLTFNFADLYPFETRNILASFNINSPTDTPPVNMGDELNFSATATGMLTDELPIDNTHNLAHGVLNSFDPNDKTCLQGSVVSTEMIGEYVSYMIRFENTGTFPAQNIVVKDMIDLSKFEINSLVPLHGSHPFVTRITEGNKVEFVFENIQLPFEDDANDGFVTFKIRTKSTLAAGETFSNSASIYFDYNLPIITNTATTSIELLGNPDFSFGDHFSIYPVPAQDVLNIMANGASIKSVTIYGMLGQVMARHSGTGISAVDVSHLANGHYIIEIDSDKGRSSTQFVK